MSDSELICTPIGYVRTAKRFKFDAPNQPRPEDSEVNTIELLPNMQFELALQDLASFDTIWLVWWFHRNVHWRPRVMPPRGPAERRGVFATRAPHRPNPIGLTSVSLLGVHERSLEVGPLDLVDGTPILDIKPYIRTVDAHPTASLGWIESIETEAQAAPPYRIELSALAARELTWLAEHYGVDFTDRAFRILERDPTPHRTRRVLQIEDNLYRIGCGAWRMYYSIKGALVCICEINKGYSDESLATAGHDEILDREAQIAFAAWKANGTSVQG